MCARRPPATPAGAAANPAQLEIDELPLLLEGVVESAGARADVRRERSWDERVATDASAPAGERHLHAPADVDLRQCRRLIDWQPVVVDKIAVFRRNTRPAHFDVCHGRGAWRQQQATFEADGWSFEVALFDGQLIVDESKQVALGSRDDEACAHTDPAARLAEQKIGTRSVRRFLRLRVGPRRGGMRRAEENAHENQGQRETAATLDVSPTGAITVHLTSSKSMSRGSGHLEQMLHHGARAGFQKGGSRTRRTSTTSSGSTRARSCYDRRTWSVRFADLVCLGAGR